MGNDASRVAVVNVCRGSLVRAQVGARRGTEAILLHARVCVCGFCVLVKEKRVYVCFSVSNLEENKCEGSRGNKQLPLCLYVTVANGRATRPH